MDTKVGPLHVCLRAPTRCMGSGLQEFLSKLNLNGKTVAISPIVHCADACGFSWKKGRHKEETWPGHNMEREAKDGASLDSNRMLFLVGNSLPKATTGCQPEPKHAVLGGSNIIMGA